MLNHPSHTILSCWFGICD